MGLEFTNSPALVLLVLIPAALYFARRSIAGLSRARAAASAGARVLLLLLVALALAGIRMKTTSRDLAVIFLVDVSASANQDEQRAAVTLINQEIERAAPRDYVGVIAFGREASVELAPTRKELLGDWRLAEISSNPPRDYTNIAGAMRLAAAIVPEAAIGRIVLISDGNENLESAVEEARLLAAEGVEVFTRAMSAIGDRARAQGEIALRDLVAPEMLAEGEAFDLKVTIDSTRDTDVSLRVFRNDSLIATRNVHLSAAGENVFLLPQRNDQKGFYTYRAEIEAIQSDGFVQNNAREAFTVVEGRPKTLYLHGDAQPSAAMLRALAEGNFAADIGNAARVPTTLAGFQDYDLVIFDNVPASALTTEQMKMAQSYVRELGGGFIMIGGDQSFGPGGYYKTPVEEMLPVSLDVRQKKHFPSLALALVIDRSGSMAGEKIQLAKEAAGAVVDFLSDRDSIGVVAFDSEPAPIVNLMKVEDKQAIIRNIRSIEVGGGTVMYSGLRMAYDWLLASDAQIKHIIALSDGQSEDGDFQGVARSVREQGMTLSTVAVGEDADFQMMKMLASGGGGRFYATDSPDNLPRIFTREAFLASRSTIIEEPFVPRHIRATQATDGIDWSAAPQLGGYVGTAERDSIGSPAITALVSDKDDPVYAVWQYGLGRATAFTSDAKARWAADWMKWSGFGQFWTQALRDTIRRNGASELVPRVEINAGRGHINVEAGTPEGDFRNRLRLRARVIAPDLSSADIALEQTAAGRYEADFAATSRGAYLVSVFEEGGSSAPATGAINSYSPEFSISIADTNLLARISEATGGSVIQTSAQASAADAANSASNANQSSGAQEKIVSRGDANLFERRATKTRPREIWEALVLMALLLLPIDVGIRRLHITREQMAQAREWVASRLRRPAVSSEDVETAPALAQLKGARSRVRLGDAGIDLSSVETDPSREQSISQPGEQARRDRAQARKISSTAQQGRDLKTESASSAAVEASEAQPLATRLLNTRRKRRE